MSDVDQESNQIIGYYSAYDNFQQSTSSVKKALLERLTSCSLTSEETFMRGFFPIAFDFFVLIFSCPSSSIPAYGTE